MTPAKPLHLCPLASPEQVLSAEMQSRTEGGCPDTSSIASLISYDNMKLVGQERVQGQKLIEGPEVVKTILYLKDKILRTNAG